MDPTIWMICVSEHRPEMIPNIVANWARIRTEPRAKLLFISNHPYPENDKRVTQIRPIIGSLGLKRNAALQYIRALDPDSLWATMDDDDYLGRAYATECLFSLGQCDLSGKSKFYIYLPTYGTCQIQWRYPAGSSLAGHTKLTIFRDLHLGEDMDLINVAKSTGMKIGIRSEYHYVYVRHDKNTWKVPELTVLIDQQDPIPHWIQPSPALINGESPPPPDSFITLPHMSNK